MPKITKTAIDAMSPDASRDTYLWDSALAGFGVRMMPTGRASFILKYRTRSGAARKMVIARVGTITPDEARKEAIKSLAEVAKGGDPSSDRKAARKNMKLAELADLYVADMKDGWKENTYLANTSQIETHIKPLLGQRDAVSINYSDVTKMQADIAAGKTAKKRKGRGGVTTGGKGVASRAVVILGAVLNHGIRHDILTRNVADGVKREAARKRTRFLSFDELRTLGRIFDDSPAEPTSGLNAIRFLLLTGFRRNEGLTLKGQYCMPEKGTISLRDTKTGAQVRAVGKVAFEGLLVDKEDWVFPAERGKGHFVGLPKCLDRICTEAGIQGVSAHTLRHTFASVAATLGYSELTIAGLLGHAAGSVTAGYAHVADAALVSAANHVSDVIARALAGDDIEGELFPA
ncbi:site-specific integrase [Salipiger sp. PrR003]|uniref:site-specific integrase n=1 Tax=Salipiger sp. PrR003 TaxID=2706776 RepID=UPI0013DB88CF|nr:site-specific integrase [Salipiger sp. PrR003]NDV53938.1 integrase arm-type DNA-binding domain-containing protein [Salipiger sp. PrR003]